MKKAKWVTLVLMSLGTFGCALAAEPSEDGAIDTIGSEMFVDLGEVSATRDFTVCFAEGGGEVTSYGSDKCMDVDGAGTANGTRIQMWGCNQTDAQHWSVHWDGTIRALGKCLDVAGGGTDWGTPVQLWGCNGTGAQKWYPVEPDGKPGVILRNPQSNLCLDVTDGSQESGTKLQIWDCNGTDAQRWKLPNLESDSWMTQQLRDAVANSWPAVSQATFNSWGTCTDSLDPETTTVIRLRWGDGSYSSRDALGRREVTLHNWPDDEQANRTTIVHEFGHVLGFEHEQGRPENRDGRYCAEFQDGSWYNEPSAGSPNTATWGVFDPGSVDNYCLNRSVGWSLSRNDIGATQQYYGSRSFRRALWASGTWRSTDMQVATGGTPYTLHPGEAWKSVDGKVELRLQSDGQLAIIRNDLQNFAPLWTSNRTAVEAKATFGSDGVLRVRNGLGITQWRSTATSHPNARLSIQHDGNVVITDTSGVVRWAAGTEHRDELEGATGLITFATLQAGSTKTTKSGHFELNMQSDGNLVVYDKWSGNRAVWASGTNGTAARMARMMANGTLALLDYTSHVVWTAPYTGKPGTFLALQEDGNLVAYEPSKYEVWRGGGSAGNGAVGSFDPVYTSNPVVLWNGQSLAAGQTRTSSSGKSKLTMQTDGNLVLYVNTAASGQPANWVAKWASNTWNTAGYYSKLDAAGALQVLTNSGGVLYDSGTVSYRNTYLTFTDSGTVRIYRVVTVGAEDIGFGS